ncbi:hypothetical protein [Desulfogranum marinum]|uniref:hypothetical protein n=1 Tax=Desulfogranum marinum TaxID=453220 RepID=UPI0019648227|nr:hypothetical protein [Desulfogranum marinum]MBM9514954.1 hypothetical protein [Desulfogranum marinum]
MKTKRMVISFSAEQTEKYFNIMTKQTAAEIEEDCVPSGATITVKIMPPFGEYADINNIDIGEVSVDFILD